MKLSRLHVVGFGKIVDASFDFGPALNLLVGENESGKSTVQQALLAALYGFYEYREGKGRRTAAEGELEAHYQPWGASAHYATRIEYELDAGRRLRLERRFAGSNSDLQVHDLSRGEQIALTADRYGGLPPAAQQQYVGAARAVFLSSACIDQGKLSALTDARSLSEALVKSLDSNEADVSAKDALKLLDDTYRRSIGYAQARSTELLNAKRELAQAKKDLEAWDRRRDAVDADMRAEAALTRQLEPMRAEVERLKLAKLRRELADQEALLGRLAAAEERLRALEAQRDGMSAYRAFDGAPQAEVLDIRSRLQQAVARTQELAQRQASEAHPAQSLRERLAQQHGVAAQLQHLAPFPVERQPEVRALHNAWVSARERLAAAREQAPVRVEAPAAGGRGFSLPVFLLGGLVALVLAVAGIALDFVVPGLVLALVALAVAAAVASRSGAAPGPVAAQYVAPDTSAYEEAAVATRRQLETALAQAGITGVEPDEAVRRFDAMVVDKYRWQEAEREAEQTRRTLLGLAEHDAELQRAGEQEARLRQRFRDLMATAGVGLDDVDAAYQQYERKRSGHERFRALEGEVAAAARERDAGLAGRSMAQIEERSAELAERLTQLSPLAGQAAAPVGASLTSAAIEAAIGEVTGKQHEAEKEIVQLHERIAQGLPPGAGRGEIEERVGQWEREVAKLERFGAALERAMEHLAEATKEARADFVPRLNASVGHTVAAITAGRYDDVFLSFVEGDLGIGLSGPETPQRVDVSALSVGTVEQCYIGLRLAIAGLLSQGGERLPLILDDPFVNFDRPRLERMLAFLVELSREHQVLLFSKDDSLPAWFAAHVPEPERLKVFPMGTA
ncbi:MAG: ATP-binding protein [Anaerolineae bacterium]